MFTIKAIHEIGCSKLSQIESVIHGRTHRQMLKYILSDGKKDVIAVEMHPLQGLSIKSVGTEIVVEEAIKRDVWFLLKVRIVQHKQSKTENDVLVDLKKELGIKAKDPYYQMNRKVSDRIEDEKVEEQIQSNSPRRPSALTQSKQPRIISVSDDDDAILKSEPSKPIPSHQPKRHKSVEPPTSTLTTLVGKVRKTKSLKYENEYAMELFFESNQEERVLHLDNTLVEGLFGFDVSHFKKLSLTDAGKLALHIQRVMDHFQQLHWEVVLENDTVIALKGTNSENKIIVQTFADMFLDF